MDTEQFDDIVRKKMDQPMQAEDPRAWDLFMLSAMERGEEALFEDTSADEIVKSALTDFKPEYKEDSWDSLSKKLDIAAMDTEEPQIVQAKFDKVVSNSLKGITRKYDAATWPKLAARIDAEEKYLKHYYRAKAIESLLFCFFVLTLFQFIQAGKLKAPELGLKDKETASILNTINSVEGSVSALPKNNLPADYNPGNQIGRLPISTKSTQNTSNYSQGIDRVLDQQNVTFREHFQLISLYPSSLNQPTSLDQSLVGIDHKIPTQVVHSNAFSSDQLDNELTEIPLARSINLVKSLTKAVAGTWKFGMYTHSDYNQIYLPDQYLLIYGIKSPLYSAQTVKSMGYGAGFKAHYLKKRIGGEIGLGYSKRSYTPNRKYYLDPFWNINFKRIEYDIVEMPIALKYTSKGNTRLKTYASAGVNANFIAKAIYDVLPEIKQVTTSNDLRLTVEQNYIKNRVEDQFTVLDKRRALLYGQGSLGMEWKVNTKMDIYSQLTYSQRVLTKQFGPNWDQFRSLSLELGVKTSIN